MAEAVQVPTRKAKNVSTRHEVSGWWERHHTNCFY